MVWERRYMNHLKFQIMEEEAYFGKEFINPNKFSIIHNSQT